MGTNFYARIIPSEDSKTKLKKLIDNNDFNEIEKYKQVGWYEPETLYAPDGRTMLVSPFKTKKPENRLFRI